MGQDGLVAHFKQSLPGRFVRVALDPHGLRRIVGNIDRGQDVGADEFYGITHVHVAGLVAEPVIAVEDGAVESAHAETIGRRGRLRCGRGCCDGMCAK